MKVVVFDDKKSLVHFLCGVLSYFTLTVFVVFFAYEFLEQIYLYKKEKEANFIGDVIEFLVGIGFARLFFEALRSYGMFCN